MQETQEKWVRSLGLEDPLEKEVATHCGILAWEIPWQRSLADYSPWGCKKLDKTEQLTLSLFFSLSAEDQNDMGDGGREVRSWLDKMPIYPERRKKNSAT